MTYDDYKKEIYKIMKDSKYWESLPEEEKEQMIKWSFDNPEKRWDMFKKESNNV